MPSDREECGESGLLNREKLTGDWWGARTTLANVGLCFDPFIVIDWSKNTRGGLDTGGEALRHLFSFNATLDLQKLLDWPSGRFYVDFQSQAGQAGSDEVGDYQCVGNWDADGLTQLSELWFEYEFFDGQVRTKIGKVDANSEFGYSELSCEFVHASTSCPATNLLLPTYPDPATSINVFYYPYDWLSVGFGLYDGALQEGVRTGARGPSTFFGEPSDLYMIGEIGLHWHLGPDGLPGRLAVGGWHHTGTFDRFDSGQEDGTSGFTFVADQMIWLEEPPGEEPAGFDAQGIGVFAQYDYADPQVMPADHHLNGGFTWRGAIPGRDQDLLGLMLGWIHFSDEPGAGFTDRYELAAELMYKAWLTPAAAIQPYVQHITNPGGAGLRDAVNVGVRVVVNF
jgi:porin